MQKIEVAKYVPRIQLVEQDTSPLVYDGQTFVVQNGILLPYDEKVTVEDLVIENTVPRGWVSVEVPEELVHVSDDEVRDALRRGDF